MSAAASDGEAVTVHVPAELPMLTTAVSRILLSILIELTDIEILDRPQGREPDDC